MKFLKIYIVTLFTIFGLWFNVVSAAPSISHSHNERTHAHILPATGVKHYHKHMHNGRVHIHPYSAKVGFTHSHNLTPRAKAWANAVKHEHAGRLHSHPLPRTGMKHQHSHKHGGRSHIHPFPVTDAKHFHKLNNKAAASGSRQSVSPSKKPRIISALSIKQQMALVLKTPLGDIPKTNQSRTALVEKPQKKIKFRDKKYSSLLKSKVGAARPVKSTSEPKRKIPVRNKNTISKVPAYHHHDGRAHQHPLPASGVKHAHKHAHAGRIHSHLIPISETTHSHTKTANAGIVKPTRKVLPKKRSNTVKTVRTVKKARVNNRKVEVRKRSQSISKPQKPRSRSIKPTPKQIADGNKQFNLALRYENGKGVKKNLQQAVNWYLRASRQGNAKAQFKLASMYENGQGVARNIPQAIHWYTSAAINGDVNAQVKLGNQYARGNIVPKNIKEAAKWYKRAADQGDMRGRANLNYLIEDKNNGVIKR